MRPRKQVNQRRKQFKRPKKKVREKFFFEDTPGVDLDFIEVQLPARESFVKDDSCGDSSGATNKHYGYKNLDEFIREHADRYLKQKDRPYGDLLKDKRRVEKLQHKLDRAASLYFTDVQFKVYVLRYKCGVKEKAIAHQLNCNQSYVASVLKNINQKFKNLFRLTKRKRQYKQHYTPSNETPPKK